MEGNLQYGNLCCNVARKDEDKLNAAFERFPTINVCYIRAYSIYYRCTVQDCPQLEAPINGYFVHNECLNVFNSACGIR